MSDTNKTRRCFLQGLTCGLAVPLFAKSLRGAAASSLRSASSQEKLYASSRQNESGKNEAVIFSPLSGDQRVVPLPERAHDVTAHPFKSEVVAVARRPGRFLVVFSADKTKPPLQLSAKKGRHFQGHGVFSHDGRLFFSAESDYEGERSVIGVRDVTKDYQQIGEYDAGGIGIHEINLHPNGQTLVVANGGILTHPDTGRAKLNLSTMKPSLAYIDANTGQMLEKQTLPEALHQLSIRHFAINPKGIVVFGCQFQGPKHKRRALVGVHKRGEKLSFLKMPKAALHQMQNYVGSVSVDLSGRIAAVSAPRGNLVAFWDIEKKQYLTSISFADGCGIAPTQKKNHFLMSNGQGEVIDFNVLEGQKKSSAYHASTLRWDNHMLAL